MPAVVRSLMGCFVVGALVAPYCGLANVSLFSAGCAVVECTWSVLEMACFGVNFGDTDDGNDDVDDAGGVDVG